MTDFHQADRPRSAETARAQAIRARWQAVLDRYDPDSELHHTAREMLWLLDQLRAAQEEIATLSRRTVIAETHNIELSDSLLRSESALQARASAGALMKDTIKAAYAEGFADAREDTASVSTDAEDIEPFWRQSLSAKIQAPSVATTGSDEALTSIAAGVEAIQTNFSATLGHTHSNGNGQPDDYEVLSIAILALRRLAKSNHLSSSPTPPPDAPKRG